MVRQKENGLISQQNTDFSFQTDLILEGRLFLPYSIELKHFSNHDWRDWLLNR